MLNEQMHTKHVNFATTMRFKAERPGQQAENNLIMAVLFQDVIHCQRMFLFSFVFPFGT